MNISYPPCQPSFLAFDRARASVPLPAVPDQPPAGSLVLIDQFQDSQAGAAHGNVAAFAARQQGFRGNIYAENIVANQPSLPPFMSPMQLMPTPQRSVAARQLLNSAPQDPAFTRQAVDAIGRYRAGELLDSVSGDLDRVRQRGLHDSAVNISYGITPQLVAEDLYRDVRTGSAPGSPTHQLSNNILNAYGLDRSRLDSSDPAVSGPERARLQQALLQAAERSFQAPDVQQAQQRYDRSVHALEARNNSVVVSVGNQQEILGHLTADAGGRAPQVGPGSNHNVLANREVTTVGATRWFDSGRERIASYSNRDPEVDLYASGSVGNGLDVNRRHSVGTSFAAPRVAATMATLHGTHPGLSSSAVENLMRNRLTHPLEGADVLDYQRTEEYMRRGTF